MDKYRIFSGSNIFVLIFTINTFSVKWKTILLTQFKCANAFEQKILFLSYDTAPNLKLKNNFPYNNTFAKLFQGKLYHHILWLQF